MTTPFANLTPLHYGCILADPPWYFRNFSAKGEAKNPVAHYACMSTADYVMQCQTGLLVSEREWLDFISYSGGLPMAVVRVWPDDAVQGAIIEAAAAFEAKLAECLEIYRSASVGLIPTERRIEQEMFA